MAKRVLSVAEKPSVAKELAKILSNGRFQTVRPSSFFRARLWAYSKSPPFAMQRKGRSQYNMIFEFQYEMNGMQCDMAVTSVTGHLMETDFPPEFKKWSSCDPSALLDLNCPVLKFVRPVRT